MAPMTGTVAPEEVAQAPEAPDRSWLGRLKQADSNWWLVAAMAGTFVVVFAPLVYRRHANFASFSWDMGIFDQAVWLLAHGKTFITVRGLDFFGHHGSFAMYLLAPFYWLGAGPHFLNIVQVLSLAAGAAPVFLLGRDRLGRGWMPLAVVAVYLLHPALGFMSWELFHPEVMAITPLLFAWWLATKRRWGWYAAALIYAVLWKEDVALAALVIGVMLAFRKDTRRVGLITAGAALLWWIVITRVMLPAVAGEAFYGQLYQGIGSTPGRIAYKAVTDPTNITNRLTNGEARTYLWQMFAPYGFFPLAGLGSLLGLPQLVANLLSDYIWTREIKVHYAAIPIAGLTIGMVEGVAWIGRRLKAAPILVGALVLVAVMGTVTWGISPISRDYDRGYWGYDVSRLEVKREAVAMVPAGEATSATYLLVPHLAHRAQIYEFPNPFQSKNWGIRDQDPHDPDDVRWIVADRQTMGQDDVGVLESVLNSGSFRIRFNRLDVVVAERVTPAAGTKQGAGKVGGS
jgi:uncharacterized membrane protein